MAGIFSVDTEVYEKDLSTTNMFYHSRQVPKYLFTRHFTKKARNSKIYVLLEGVNIPWRIW